ncbi:hypothetical protein AAG906_000018 [Vitis piasezkii]
MDCVSPILDIAACIWDCSAKRANRGEDVRRRVELAEQQQMMRRREVAGWLLNVEVIESEVSRVLQEGDREVQKRCLRSCPRNCWSSYKIGKMVRRKLDAVFKLKDTGSFDVVAYRVPCSLVDERPMEKTVGLDLTYERVCSCLKDGQVGIIGLYGMGVHDFDIVIWVVVSKPARIEKVQEVIRNKLQIQDDLWKNRTEDEKAAEIWKYLKTKSLVPLPNDQNMSKIVFTTRLENVCHQMRAQERIKLECLESTEALALFLKEVGEDTLNSHSDILKLAKVVAEECKGLPLALITIGRAMASMNGPLAWEQAIQELRKFPAEIIGMEDDLFYCLKFSYDSLRDEVLKSCFIYCSMVLDEFEDIYEARDRGHKVIGNLKHACLLESGESEKRVKMHDVIRDMALWLACECGVEKKSFYFGLVRYSSIDRVIWGIDKLVTLQYLNLSRTNISELPIEMKNLKELRCLLMDFSSLQLLSMYKAYRFSVVMEGISHKLQRCIRRLCLDDCEDLTCFELSSSSIKRMEHLEKLEIWTCCQLEDMKINKEERHGFIPDDILDLKFNGYFSKLHHVIIVTLQILYVEDCALMEDIMGNDSAVSEIDENLGIFSRLTSLNLINLPRLKSIYPQPLPFPSLEEINVVACLMLRSLPFDVNSATKSLKMIGGEQRWWARLQWGMKPLSKLSLHISLESISPNRTCERRRPWWTVGEYMGIVVFLYGPN